MPKSGDNVVMKMTGSAEAPPRWNGELVFHAPWEARAFGLAVALSEQKHYAWEEFRQALITSIGEWEAKHTTDDPEWSYYDRWLLALERIVLKSKLISDTELATRTAEFLTGKREEVF